MQSGDLTVPQVAKILGVHESTVRRWIATGAMKAKALPSKPGQSHIFYRVSQKEVDRARHLTEEE